LLFIFVFLPVFILIYYAAPKIIRNLVIVAASLIFYAWGEPIYILIMLFAAVFDFTNGLLIDKFRDNKKACRAVLIGSLTVNLGILCFFKYYGFLLSNINALFHLNIAYKSLPLPLGISFYTFQSMSYVIDVYLGKVKAQKNILIYATFVTMFPQLVAGPIVKYIDISKQIENRKESMNLFGEGAELFIIGLSKKVLLANNIGMLWDTIKATPASQLSIASSWLGIIAFTFQIYFDFSGYSDMAMGLGRMMGFHLTQNFNYPYISKSITEFWRRWHMSLGSWFREYVYIPLGGNRKGRLKQYRNIFIVWFLTGFWHGANWNFILWGLYFGAFVTIEKIFLLKWLDKRPKFIAHIYTLLVVVVGWVFFEFENMQQGISFLKTMFGLNSGTLIDSNAIYYIYTNIILFVILAVCSTPVVRNIMLKLKEKIQTVGVLIMPAVYALLLFFCTAYLVNQSYNPFLYFRF
jgi:alginate O-acetyltransferase complex protein AlgI